MTFVFRGLLNMWSLNGLRYILELHMTPMGLVNMNTYEYFVHMSLNRIQGRILFIERLDPSRFHS
jgi:hypothetical protein